MRSLCFIQIAEALRNADQSPFRSIDLTSQTFLCLIDALKSTKELASDFQKKVDIIMSEAYWERSTSRSARPDLNSLGMCLASGALTAVTDS